MSSRRQGHRWRGIRRDHFCTWDEWTEIQVFAKVCYFKSLKQLPEDRWEMERRHLLPTLPLQALCKWQQVNGKAETSTTHTMKRQYSGNHKCIEVSWPIKAKEATTWTAANENKVKEDSVFPGEAGELWTGGKQPEGSQARWNNFSHIPVLRDRNLGIYSKAKHWNQSNLWKPWYQSNPRKPHR